MNLTKIQKEAILSLKQIQKDRLFVGITPGIVEKDFLEINQKLLTANEAFAEKLRASEQALFALCGYTPLAEP